MRRLLFLAVLPALLVATARGADTTNAPSAPPAAPAKKPGQAKLIAPVRALLENAAKYYAAHNTLEADLAADTTMTMNGSKQQFDSTFHLAIKRPNLAAITLKTGMMGGNYVSNGKTLIADMPMARRYITSDAPADLTGLFDAQHMVLALGGLPLGFEDFFKSDPTAKFETGLTQSEDLGPDPIGGKPARHVRLTNIAYATDLWIADGDAPLLLQAQVSPDLSSAFSHMRPDQKAKMPPGFTGMKMVRTTVYTNWKIDQPIADTAFDYKPPADYTAMGTRGTAEKPHPLTGKPAPDFTLKDLDGKSVTLQHLRGKVVVLDFWATWCGPCGMALPLVSKAALDLKAKGVAFYAIDEQEDTAAIKKFLTDKNLTIPVLLDTAGKAGQLYQANAIPETVVIDKTGKIQSVHVGYDPDIQKILTKQLTDLLAGKDHAAGKAR